MGILGSLERCIHLIPKELIENLMFYVELDPVTNEELKNEIDRLYTISATHEFTLEEKKVKDFGNCQILTFNGYKVIISVDPKAPKSETFYLAFKTKII